MGAVLREQNALPYKAWEMHNLMAKPDINNVGAGRAAKGASPVSSSKKARLVIRRPCFFVDIMDRLDLLIK